MWVKSSQVWVEQGEVENKSAVILKDTIEKHWKIKKVKIQVSCDGKCDQSWAKYQMAVWNIVFRKHVPKNMITCQS